MPAGFFEVSGCCSSRLSPAGHGCLRHSTNLSPLRSCPSHFGSLPPPSQTLLNSNLVPLHAAISVICLLCHLQNATPRLTVSTPPWFCLSDQFCAFSPAVPGSHRLAPHSWELCWGLGKALAVAMGPVGGGNRTLGSAGCLAGCQSSLSQGKVTRQCRHCVVKSCLGETPLSPQRSPSPGELFVAGIREQRTLQL